MRACLLGASEVHTWRPRPQTRASELPYLGSEAPTASGFASAGARRLQWLAQAPSEVAIPIMPPSAHQKRPAPTRPARYAAAIAVVVVGILCGAAIPGTVGGTVCTALVGLGLVAVISLIFYDVGLSEDRDRDRETRAATRRREEEAAAPPHVSGRRGHETTTRSRPIRRLRDSRRELP